MSNYYQRPIVFGEVLFDHFPNGKRKLGGAPFNVAWNLNGFGLNPIFISRVGIDEEGKEIIQGSDDWGMDTSFIQQDKEGKSTGKVIVSFDKDNEPQYDISQGCAYHFVSSDEFQVPNDVKNGDTVIFYHGTLAVYPAHASESLNNVLEKLHMKGCNVKRFIDVNIRTPYWEKSTVQQLLLQEDVKFVKLNMEELELLLPNELINNQTKELFSQSNENTTDKTPNRIQEQILQLGKEMLTCFQLELLIVTRGAKGAILFSSTMVQPVSVEPSTVMREASENDVSDAVGAGDAFASVIIAGICNHWAVADMVANAQQFASKVVTIQGAVSSNKSFYALD